MTTVNGLGWAGSALALLVLVALGPVAASADTVDLTQAAEQLQLTPLRGAPAPPLTLAGLDGRRVSLGDLGGHPVILYFWATW